MLKRFLSKTWSLNLILVRVGIGLLLQKIIALKYGPLGTTYLSHFQNFISLITQPIQDIIGQGLINGVSKRNISDKLWINASITFGSFLLIILLSLTILFRQFSLAHMEWDYPYNIYIILAIILLAIQLIFMNYLIAKGEIKALLVITLVGGLLTLSTLYFLQFTLNNFLIIYLLIQAASSFLFPYYTYRNYPQIFKIDLTSLKKTKKHFYNFLAIGITVWLCSQLTSFMIRSFAMAKFPVDDTGHWQAIARISDAYKGLFVSYLMITLFPLLSSIKDPLIFKKSFKRYFKRYASITTLFLFVIYLIKGLILTLLYEPSYQQATSFFNWQIAGDFLALLSFPFAILLLSKLSTQKYIIAELIGTILYLFAIGFLPMDTIGILFLAYFIRYFIYLTLVFIFTRKYLNRA